MAIFKGLQKRRHFVRPRKGAGYIRWTEAPEAEAEEKAATKINEKAEAKTKGSQEESGERGGECLN